MASREVAAASSADPPLPAGWAKLWSNSQKRWYWNHKDTSTSQWHPPSEEDAQDPLAAKRKALEKTIAEKGLSAAMQQHIQQQQGQKRPLSSGAAAAAAPPPSAASVDGKASSSDASDKKRTRAESDGAPPGSSTGGGGGGAASSSSSSSSSLRPSASATKGPQLAAAGPFSSSSSAPAFSEEGVRVAIIVPFRDLHVEQNRMAHLKKFVPYMTNFLSRQRGIEKFKIFIIEQSADDRKFNRGKLLNIGFHLASRSAEDYNVFIYHDVDLLPSDDLGSWYGRFPRSPIHIARVWERYSNNPKYFGGIVSFNASDMKRINGYPNNFWGWGGEDDEMQKRCETLGVKWHAPEKGRGTITDLEDMTLTEKVQHLKEHSEWKCQKKWEVMDEHQATWRTNGLDDLNYAVLAESHELCATGRVVKFTVDVKLNGTHWTNDESSADFVMKHTKK